jgi:hypothetical protein
MNSGKIAALPLYFAKVSFCVEHTTLQRDGQAWQNATQPLSSEATLDPRHADLPRELASALESEEVI